MNLHCMVKAAMAVCLPALVMVAAAAEGDGSGERGYIDTHVHLMVLSENPGDQVAGAEPQRGSRPGVEAHPVPPGAGKRWLAAGPTRTDASDYLAAGEVLLKLMDQHGVRTVLLMPPPQIPGQAERAGNTSADNLAVVKRHPDRFALVAGGHELNPLIHGVKPADVTESVRKTFRREAEKLVALGAKGFGEMSVLHVAMQEKHNFSHADADHPLFRDLADIAADRDIPIDIHMEAVINTMKTPPFLAGVSHNPSELPPTIAPFERLLKHNRKARIVWQHIGWDNTGGQTSDLVRRLLGTHPNLFAALRQEEVNPRMRPFRPNSLAGDDGRLKQEWRKVIEEFPDRFMVGSDEFVGSPGARRMPKSFAQTWAILAQLPPALARKVGRENAVRVYKLE